MDAEKTHIWCTELGPSCVCMGMCVCFRYPFQVGFKRASKGQRPYLGSPNAKAGIDGKRTLGLGSDSQKGHLGGFTWTWLTWLNWGSVDMNHEHGRTEAAFFVFSLKKPENADPLLLRASQEGEFSQLQALLSRTCLACFGFHPKWFHFLGSPVVPFYRFCFFGRVFPY